MHKTLRNVLMGSAAYMAIAFSMQTGMVVDCRVFEPSRVNAYEAEFINHIDDLRRSDIHCLYTLKQKPSEGLIYAKVVWS